LQLATPELDRIALVRLDVVGDASGDDPAFAQAHCTERLALKLTTRSAMPRGLVLPPAHSTKSPC
jgi:hypothetical protein